MNNQEAIEYIQEWLKDEYALNGKDRVVLNMAIEALQGRPKGEWIENDDFTCSECGYHKIVGDGAYNFCPNCGADMKGGRKKWEHKGARE